MGTVGLGAVGAGAVGAGAVSAGALGLDAAGLGTAGLGTAGLHRGAGDELSEAEQAQFDARFRDAARLIAEGRLARAILLRRETSERRYRGVQIVVGEFELEDGDAAPRTIVYEHIFGPAFARHWRPGGTVDAWIDPHDPENVYIGR